MRPENVFTHNPMKKFSSRWTSEIMLRRIFSQTDVCVLLVQDRDDVLSQLVFMSVEEMFNTFLYICSTDDRGCL